MGYIWARETGEENRLLRVDRWGVESKKSGERKCNDRGFLSYESGFAKEYHLHILR